MYSHITHSPEETQRIAADFAHTLVGGEVIALVGDVGAGKTTFTQGLVRALGTSARPTSPTFAVLHEYPITEHPTITLVVHIDFYRFTEGRQVHALELDEYRNAHTVILAEWPERVGKDFWGVTHTLTFSSRAPHERMINW